MVLCHPCHFQLTRASPTASAFVTLAGQQVILSSAPSPSDNSLFKRAKFDRDIYPIVKHRVPMGCQHLIACMHAALEPQRVLPDAMEVKSARCRCSPPFHWPYPAHTLLLQVSFVNLHLFHDASNIIAFSQVRQSLRVPCCLFGCPGPCLLPSLAYTS